VKWLGHSHDKVVFKRKRQGSSVPSGRRIRADAQHHVMPDLIRHLVRPRIGIRGAKWLVMEKSCPLFAAMR